jgi:hypothetical protein
VLLDEFGYRTNLTPTEFPRRQTTAQFRPVRASRENASRNFAGKVLQRFAGFPLLGQSGHFGCSQNDNLT